MVGNIKKLLIVFYFICISQLLTGCIFLIGDLLDNIETVIGSQEIEVEQSYATPEEYGHEPIPPQTEEAPYEYTVLPYFKDKQLCYVGEVYHEQDEICTLPVTCDSNETCATWGDKVIRELETKYSGFTEYYGIYVYEEEDDEYPYIDEGYFEQHFNSEWAKQVVQILNYKDEYDEEVVAVFPLEDFDLVFPEEYEDEYYSEWYWDEFSWIIPSEQLWMLDSFSLFVDDKLLAYVVEVQEDLSKWHLAININTNISYQDSISTNIHEFAHLLFLNSTQLDPYKICLKTAYVDDKGCAKTDSYTNQFAKKFGEKYNGIYDENLYVTEYASSDLLEDMAETFYMFVLTPKPDGNTIKDQKILFYYNYDELVLLRANILSRVASYMYRVLYYEEY